MKHETADAGLIQAAIVGLEVQRDRLDAKIADIRAQLGQGSRSGAVTTTEAPKKRKMSAAVRRRMSLGQKRRWAAVNKGDSVPATQPRKKRKMSAAGRARIIAATKKRWAAYRKAKA